MEDSPLESKFEAPTLQITTILANMVGELAKALEQIQGVIEMQLDHNKEHHKFYCPTCDTIDIALKHLIRK